MENERKAASGENVNIEVVSSRDSSASKKSLEENPRLGNLGHPGVQVS